MSHGFVEQAIEIQAPVAKVWRVFTDPTLTRQMGGEYVSEWQVGAALRWKGLDGQLRTNGTILKIEPQRLLQHNLLSLDQSAAKSVLSVITYEFRAQNGSTTLRAREDFTRALNDADNLAMREGWEAALQCVKAIAEKP